MGLLLVGLVEVAVAQHDLMVVERAGPTDPYAASVYNQNLAGAGDVDGDGTPDWMWSSSTDVSLFSGRDGAILHTFSDGAQSYPFYEFRFTGVGIGDVDGDGVPDIAVAAGGDESGGTFNGLPCGAARVYSGKSGATLVTWLGSAPLRLGDRISAVGDANLDGCPDLVASLNVMYNANYSAAAQAWLLSGNPVSPTLLRSFEGDPYYNMNYGYVGGVGDIDGNGSADFGVFFDSGVADRFNTFFVYDGLGGEPILDLASHDDDDYRGWRFGATTDLDGDGLNDLFLSSPGAGTYHSKKHWTGTFEIVSGVSGKKLCSRDGSAHYGFFGFDACAAGDVDGDGSTDYVVTDPDCTTSFGEAAGRVHVFVDGGSRNLDVSLGGTSPGRQTGGSVASVGDLDGDGLADLAVLDPYVVMPQGTGVVRLVSLAGAAMEPRRFVPGSRLLGSIDRADEVTETSFHAVPGMTLSIGFEGEGKLAIQVDVLSPSGELAKTWKMSKSAPKRSVHFSKSGTYRLRVRPLHGLGAYELATSLKWPKNMQWIDKTIVTQDGAPKVEFKAIAGENVSIWIEGEYNVDDVPIVTLHHESGAAIDLAPFADSFGPMDFSSDILPIPLDGKYRLRVKPKSIGKPTKVLINVYVNKPFGAERIRID